MKAFASIIFFVSILLATSTSFGGGGCSYGGQERCTCYGIPPVGDPTPAPGVAWQGDKACAELCGGKWFQYCYFKLTCTWGPSTGVYWQMSACQSFCQNFPDDNDCHD